MVTRLAHLDHGIRRLGHHSDHMGDGDVLGSWSQRVGSEGEQRVAAVVAGPAARSSH